MKRNRFTAFALAILCLFFLFVGCSGASPEGRHSPVSAEAATGTTLQTRESASRPTTDTTAEATTAPAPSTTEIQTEAPPETAPTTSAEEPEPVVTEPAAENDTTEPSGTEEIPDRASPPPETEEVPETEETELEVRYIANTNTKKFHYPSCSSVKDMKESNKWYFTGTREELIEQGYEPCKRCKP